MKKNKLNFCHYSKSRVYGHRSLRGKKVSSHFHFFSLHKVAGQNSSSKKDLYMKQPSRFLDINKKINSVLLQGQNFKNMKNRAIVHRNSKQDKNNNFNTNPKCLGRQKFFYGEIRRKISSSKRPFLQTPKNNKVSVYKEYKFYYKQKVWYRDKAALLPGANTKFITAFVQKNKFYKKMYSAYKVFKTIYAFSKKSLVKLYKNRAKNSYACSNGAQANSMEFSMLMLMDSLYSSSMCKSGLVLNKHEKDIFKNYYSNGKSVHKKNFYLNKRAIAINKDGDFSIGVNKM